MCDIAGTSVNSWTSPVPKNDKRLGSISSLKYLRQVDARLAQ
jgi:hypothetical protein